VSALHLLAGTSRLILYDLPRERAPQPRADSLVYLHTSHAWQRFLSRRRRYDDGDLTLIVALRRLAPDERRLVVDWGTTYANMLLLIEPHDLVCDLTDPAGGWRRWAEVEATRVPLLTQPAEVMAGSRLMRRLRRSYGLWTLWNEGTAQTEVIDLTADAVTLWDALARRLRERFPAEAFLAALARLWTQEPELFRGHPLRRACMPFRTRLGLPVPYEPRLVLEAARRLVNSGRAWAFEQRPDGRSFGGPTHPIPENLDDEALASLVW
jgi:hypothetical protein